jgi:membrane-bound lytic murein transglycosylase B
VPRLAPAPVAVAAAVELEIPAFLARPRPTALPAPATAPPPRAARARAPAARPRWGRIAATGAALAGLAAAAVMALAGAEDLGGPSPPPAPSTVPAVAAAAAEIPPDYLALYQQFGLEMDIDWRFLAAIGAQESDHGRNPWASQVNAEGCVGPMQLGVGGRCGDFVGAWGVDGDGDGRVNPLDPADAIATAARGLREGKGAPARGGDFDGYRRAACGYYGACADARADYADEVMARAVRYGFPR